MNVLESGIYDIEERLNALAGSIGYEWTERLEAVCSSGAISKTTIYCELKMGFSK